MAFLLLAGAVNYIVFAGRKRYLRQMAAHQFTLLIGQIIVGKAQRTVRAVVKLDKVIVFAINRRIFRIVGHSLGNHEVGKLHAGHVGIVALLRVWIAGRGKGKDSVLRCRPVSDILRVGK